MSNLDAAMESYAQMLKVKKKKLSKLAELSLPKLIPTSSAEWAKFGNKKKWDCLVALRGPDLVDSQTLKWFTSSVIRHKLIEITDSHGLVNHVLPFVVLPSGYEGTIGKFDGSHFAQHVGEAAQYLDIPICWVTKNFWTTHVVSGEYGESAHAVLVELAKVVDEPFRTTALYVAAQHGFYTPPASEGESLDEG